MDRAKKVSTTCQHNVLLAEAFPIQRSSTLHVHFSRLAFRRHSHKWCAMEFNLTAECAAHSVGPANQLFGLLIQHLLAAQCSLSPPSMWPPDFGEQILENGKFTATNATVVPCVRVHLMCNDLRTRFFSAKEPLERTILSSSERARPERSSPIG